MFVKSAVKYYFSKFILDTEVKGHKTKKNNLKGVNNEVMSL